MRHGWRLALPLLAQLGASGCAVGQPAGKPAPASFVRADTASLHRTLDSLASAHHGVLGYSILNVDTGERLARRGDETFPTASLIKVPILVTVFDLVEQGQLSLDDPLTLLRIDKVPGSGNLQFMHDGATLSVRDAAWLMSVTSDNTATNLLLDRIVIRRVWEKMEKLGLSHTKVHSKVYLRMASVAMDSSVKYGLGVTTPNEMARLFALLADGKAVSPKADSTMLDILADQVRTECALFPLQSRVAACVLTKENADQRWLIDNEAQLTLASIGRAIVSAWPRKTVK
jgi:beta-lactamase class A